MNSSDNAPSDSGNSGQPPLVIGLTGGIGSGKSTVAELFRKLGVPIIDADEVARAIVEPGKPALEEVIAAFGPACMNADGRLDRNWLRRHVFSEPLERRRLESILHPKIRLKLIELINNTRAPYCIVVIPLLIETDQTDLVDRVMVVDSPVDTQISRVEARNELSREEITAIIAAQTDRETRLGHADEIIANDGSPAHLAIIVRRLHEKYLDMVNNL